MTTQKLYKRRIRERMSRTGERYTTARQHLAPRRDRAEAEKADLSSAYDLAADATTRTKTGHGWQDWLIVLDRWGARERKHGETVDFLMTEHGVTGWWAQTITNGYERVRGMRRKHQQPTGFTIYATKTVAVPLDVLFEAFTDEALRREWLTDGTMTARSAQRGRVARFDWDDGATRVSVTFEAKGPVKATASVAHERLADAAAAEAAKTAWKERLGALKAFLDARQPSA